MSSPFLTDGDTDLSVLQDGTFTINVAAATVGDTVPGLPLHVDSRRRVTSGLIQLSDCAFAPLANPATVDLNMNSYALDNVHEATLQENDANHTPHQRRHHIRVW